MVKMISEEDLHYLIILKQNYSIFQPELRFAIDKSIEYFESKIKTKKGDINGEI